ncbi:MAG: hypothetical protein AB7G11_08715 [Phycisphaerales bacterium]
MRAHERIIVAATPVLGGAWVASRRRQYRRIGRALSRDERGSLGGFFTAALLDRVRVAVVDRIAPPWPARVLPLRRLGSLVDLSTVRGMAFGDAVACAVNPPTASLLFHEVVHVVQYEEYGIGPMLHRYVSDYFKNGRDYFAINAERCAYELQARFDASPQERFDVRNEVRRLMG